MAGVLFTLLFSNLLNVLLPLSIGLFYEAGLKEQSLKGQLLHHLFSFIDSTQRFFVFFGALVLLKSLLYFLEKYWTGLLGERFSRSLREHVFAHQMRMNMKAHRQRPTGKYLLRYSGDLNAIREFVNRGILLFAGDLFFLVAAFAALFALEGRLTVFVLGAWVLAAGLVFALSRRLRLTTFDRRSQRSKSLGFVSERLQAFYTVKSFNRERQETERYARESGRLFRYGLRFFRFSALIQALFPLFFYGTLGFVLWLALSSATQGNTSHGDFFAFVLLLLHMHTVLQRVLEVNLVWQSGTASLTKLTNLLDKTVENRETGVLPEKMEGLIEFDHVSFSFSKDKSLLNNLCFRIEPHSITVLQGQHATGKSTVLKLIQKIYEPAQGAVRFDGIDLAEVSPFEVRKKVTIVSPETPLLGNTVFQAISYNENPEKREKALELLHKLGFSLAESDELTLDYPLEEQARNLSAGQIALLQVIRELLTEKRIILLDEPFAHLDSRQAGRVARLLNRLKTRHTILVISKRPPSRLEIDQTISLDTQHESEELAADLDDSTIGP